MKVGGAMQPAPAPRYSSTLTHTPKPAPVAGSDTDAVLAELGYDSARIATLREVGALG